MLSEQPASWSMAARDLYPLICVRDSSLLRFPDLRCSVRHRHEHVAPEHPMLAETGPIYAEAGRHLAILGSCAAAMNNPTRARHYYLAREAYLERSTAPVAPQALLTCNAEADFTDKRTAHANCSLFVRDEKLFTLDVSYSVLSEALFTRFYGKHGSDQRKEIRDNVTPFHRANPYRSTNALEILNNTIAPSRLARGDHQGDVRGPFPGVSLPAGSGAHALPVERRRRPVRATNG